jgi:hypothetical protein
MADDVEKSSMKQLHIKKLLCTNLKQNSDIFMNTENSHLLTAQMYSQTDA